MAHKIIPNEKRGNPTWVYLTGYRWPPCRTSFCGISTCWKRIYTKAYFEWPFDDKNIWFYFTGSIYPLCMIVNFNDPVLYLHRSCQPQLAFQYYRNNLKASLRRPFPDYKSSFSASNSGIKFATQNLQNSEQCDKVTYIRAIVTAGPRGSLS